jgi:hypothetical protein
MFVCLICSVGCSSEINAPDNALSDSHRIELTEALSHLDAFLSVYNVASKSEGGVSRRYSLSDISTVKSSNILHYPTRSNSEVFPEDLLYLVNFSDNSGVAVLAADDRLCNNIMCVTESGSLCESDFENAFNLLYHTRIKVAEQDSEDDYSFVDMGKTTVPALLLTSVIRSITHYSEEEGCLRGTKAIPPSSTKYGPYVYTKWCQRYINGTPVFNVYTPDNAGAGCVVIATAQILLSTSNFTFQTNDNYYCYSSDMCTVAPYTNPDSLGVNDAAIQAGKFVYELGNSSLLINVSYPNIFHSGTSGTAVGVKRALEAFMYSNVVRHLGFNDNKKAIATAQIRAGRPVYLDGSTDLPDAHGHAWVLDGEWDPYYHINWGWNGALDGYFPKGLMDTTQRQLADDIIDSHTQNIPSGAYYWFSWNYRMVTYSL